MPVFGVAFAFSIIKTEALSLCLYVSLLGTSTEVPFSCLYHLKTRYFGMLFFMSTLQVKLVLVPRIISFFIGETVGQQGISSGKQKCFNVTWLHKMEIFGK